MHVDNATIHLISTYVHTQSHMHTSPTSTFVNTLTHRCTQVNKIRNLCTHSSHKDTCTLGRQPRLPFPAPVAISWGTGRLGSPWAPSWRLLSPSTSSWAATCPLSSLSGCSCYWKAIALVCRTCQFCFSDLSRLCSHGHPPRTHRSSQLAHNGKCAHA